MDVNASEIQTAFSQELFTLGILPKNVQYTEDGKLIVDIPEGVGEMKMNRISPFRFNGEDYQVQPEEREELEADDGIPVTRYTLSLQKPRYA
jgi:hypothetical protein